MLMLAAHKQRLVLVLRGPVLLVGRVEGRLVSVLMMQGLSVQQLMLLDP